MNVDPQSRKNGLSLLTIEDETGLRKSIVNYFEDSGFTVIEAADGKEGLDAFRHFNPDIVFADLCMPNGHGLDIIPVMHLESPMTPVVVISGAGMLNDAVEAMKSGAWDYVSKPVRDLAMLEKLAFQMIARAKELKRDFECHKNLKERVEEYQDSDALTGLPNRKSLSDHFDKIRVDKSAACLGLIDLDNFKAIKEAFGHAAGDQLIKEVAGRLSTIISGNDMMARLGGDEFAFLVTFDAPTTPEVVEKLASQVKQVFAVPFCLEGQEMLITSSMGFASFPDDGHLIVDLLKKADIALSRAKEQGQNSSRIYSSEIVSRSSGIISLQNNLRRALENNEFMLHYQPQVNVFSGTLTGVEALLRWQPSEGKLISPAEFIPALEESGLIIQVGEWALTNACLQQRLWVDAGYPPMIMSVNVSAKQFHTSQFAEKVALILSETGIYPAHLCLELTESIVMKDVDDTIRTLSKLRDFGVSLSLDDFGTGYSSLSYLRKMPICELKIDRSFIATIADEINNAMIVSTIISMAHCLNMHVVAEGVETVAQLEFLRANRCQTAQGFLFSKPRQADDFRDFMDSTCKIISELQTGI